MDKDNTGTERAGGLWSESYSLQWKDTGNTCIAVFVPAITQILITSLTTGIVPGCFKTEIVKTYLRSSDSM